MLSKQDENKIKIENGKEMGGDEKKNENRGK